MNIEERSAKNDSAQRQLAARLGRYGVWTLLHDSQSMSDIRAAAVEIERLGYGSMWFAHPSNRDPLVLAGVLLQATTQLIVANGIARIDSRRAEVMAVEGRTLAEAHPGRHLLGLGVGPVQVHPVAQMSTYLDGIERSTDATASVFAPRLVLAAYGPTMLRLAGARTLGAHTYLVPVQHTAIAREILGPDPLLVVEQAVLLDPDIVGARRQARELHVRQILATPYNLRKFRRLGYGEQELADGGSDRLVDDVVVAGDAEVVAARLRAHLEAGADHVVADVLGGAERFPLDAWQQLAQALR